MLTVYTAFDRGVPFIYLHHSTSLLFSSTSIFSVKFSLEMIVLVVVAYSVLKISSFLLILFVVQGFLF